MLPALSSPKPTTILLIVAVLLLLAAPLYLVETNALSLSPFVQPAASNSSPTPIFSHPGGYYEEELELEIGVSHARATILFTLDGRVPTAATGTLYRQPIHLDPAVSDVVVIRARAVLPGAEPGPVVSTTYFLGLSSHLPLLSLIVAPDDLWDENTGIYANPLQKGVAWERPVAVTYVDENRSDGFQVPAGLRIHGGYTRTYDKKSLRLYFRRQYGLSWLEYPLFTGSDNQRFKRLVIHNGGQDSPQSQVNWSLMRNQIMARLARQTDGYATHSQPVLLFINGRPWGVYQLRQRVDERFLAHEYGVESAELLDTPELNENRVLGDPARRHWDHLLEFVAHHDLANPAHYTYVETQVDVANLIDYTILQIYSGNIDWPHRNVNQFRPRVPGGRWHWLFWDSDFSLGLKPWSHVDTNMVEQALRPDHPDTGGRDTLLFRKLLQNPTFRDRFLRRSTDLLNTVLAPEAVISHIDTLAAELEPDIGYEAARWSSSVQWQDTVTALHDFARRRPAIVRQHMVDAFDLEGTASLTINAPAGGGGCVSVDGILLPSWPWRGEYFRGTVVVVTAVPQPGYRFLGWAGTEEASGQSTLAVSMTEAQTITPQFAPGDGETPQPGDVIFSRYGANGIGQDSIGQDGMGQTGTGQIEGDWFQLRVVRAGGVDLRGWRVTDNDTRTATDEGSLIFGHHPALAQVPQGTELLVVATETAANDARFPEDDLNPIDNRMVLYVANGQLDAVTDPWFNLSPDDNLALLAPGPDQAFDDDQGIAFVALDGRVNTAVTPASFGICPTAQGATRQISEFRCMPWCWRF